LRTRNTPNAIIRMPRRVEASSEFVSSLCIFVLGMVVWNGDSSC
jgi:hypothetical protein